MTPERTIRPLTPADVPVLWALNEANVPAVGTATLERMGELLALSDVALGVDLGGGLVGFCLTMRPGVPYSSENYRWFSARYGSFLYLDRVAFDAAHQGQGHGAALYREVERRAGDAAWFLLEVNLEPRNDGSLRFHAREGFVEVGQQRVKDTLVSLLAKPLKPEAPRRA